MKLKEFIKIKLEFNPLFFVILVFLLVIKKFHQIFYTFVFLIGHEMAHFLFARKRGFEIDTIQILPFGLSLKFKTYNILNSTDELFIALGGPFFNLFMAALLFLLAQDQIYIEINLILGLFNLLPVFPLDGGRILRAVVLKRSNYFKATKLVCSITKKVAAFFIFVSIISTFYSIYSIVFVFIFCFIFYNSNNAIYFTNYIGMVEFFNKKEELLKKRVFKTSIFTTTLSCNAKDVIKNLMTEAYNIVYILDNDMRVRYVLTETILLDSMLKLGYNCTIMDIIESLEENEDGLTDR